MAFSTRLLAALLLLASWLPATAQAPTPPAFAKGADVSWVTEMEAANYKFYNRAGRSKTCFSSCKPTMRSVPSGCGCG